MPVDVSESPPSPQLFDKYILRGLCVPPMETTGVTPLLLETTVLFFCLRPCPCQPKRNLSEQHPLSVSEKDLANKQRNNIEPSSQLHRTRTLYLVAGLIDWAQCVAELVCLVAEPLPAADFFLCADIFFSSTTCSPIAFCSTHPISAFWVFSVR